MRYLILRDNNIEFLEHKVRGYLADGWKPLGAPFKNDGVFHQAIIKED